MNNSEYTISACNRFKEKCHVIVTMAQYMATSLEISCGATDQGLVIIKRRYLEILSVNSLTNSAEALMRE
jgi:hypothetical protein